MFSLNKKIICYSLLLMTSGCVSIARGVTEGMPLSDEYISLYCKLNEKKEPVKLTAPLDIDIHIDGSGSMLGYTNTENSSYIQTLMLLDNVLSLNGNRSQTQVQYYRSGDLKHQAKKLSRSEFRKARKAEFYTGKNPVFPAVSSDFASIISKPKKSNRLTVIVTDLDQNDGDVSLIAQKIKASYFNQSDRDYAVGVMGIKSEFNGTVYSASDANKKFQYNTEGKNSSKYRPFYVLFLGHYQDIAEYFDQLQKEQNFGERSKFLIFSPEHLLADAD